VTISRFTRFLEARSDAKHSADFKLPLGVREVLVTPWMEAPYVFPDEFTLDDRLSTAERRRP
jgi:hypothetical protein